MYFKNEIILYHCGRPSKQLAVFKEFKTTLKLIKNHRTFSLLVNNTRSFVAEVKLYRKQNMPASIFMPYLVTLEPVPYRILNGYKQGNILYRAYCSNETSKTKTHIQFQVPSQKKTYSTYTSFLFPC